MAPFGVRIAGPRLCCHASLAPRELILEVFVESEGAAETPAAWSQSFKRRSASASSRGRLPEFGSCGAVARAGSRQKNGSFKEFEKRRNLCAICGVAPRARRTASTRCCGHARLADTGDGKREHSEARTTRRTTMPWTDGHRSRQANTARVPPFELRSARAMFDRRRAILVIGLVAIVIAAAVWWVSRSRDGI